MWLNLAAAGLEHFYLRRVGDGISADGVVIGVEEDIAFCIRYKINCDLKWRVRKAAVKSLGGDGRAIGLASDGFGNWTGEAGDPVPELKGCFDVDISATPFTNTLPIRRLGLTHGGSADVKVVYFAVPKMRVSVEPQRYTCLEAGDAGGKYKFESLDGGFTAAITVDADGLVEDYPGLFKRVWAS